MQENKNNKVQTNHEKIKQTRKRRVEAVKNSRKLVEMKK